MSTHDHDRNDGTREREVIVTDGGRSSGVGTVIAAVLGLLIVLLVGWFLFAGFGGDSGDTSIDVPDEVDVNVDPGGEGGDTGGDTGGEG